MEQLSTVQNKELRVLINFVAVYCRAKHKRAERAKMDLTVPYGKEICLCGACDGLVAHAVIKLRNCPLDPKPSCKNCHIHCYAKDYRSRIREVMAFSGRRMIMRGRLDYLWHYLF